MDINVESRFSTLPEANIERSRIKRPHSHLTTFNAGQLIPIYLEEDVLPGDTFEIDVSSLVRMSTPIFPVMDNAYLDLFFFFVPNRIVWEHWRQFMGENDSTPWTQEVQYTVPQLNSGDAGFQKGSIADYFGMPTNVPNLNVNALPFRGYVKIFNEWFRDQNVMNPAYLNIDDSNSTYSPFDSNITLDDIFTDALYGGHPLPVAKFSDYFTRSLPQPQKGSGVDLPLFDDLIPVSTSFTKHSTPGNAPLKFNFTNGPDGALSYFSSYSPFVGTTDSNDFTGTLFAHPEAGDMPHTSYDLVPNNLYADARNVAVVSISQLRQAFQIQRLLEADARGGTRYRELIQQHFNVDNMDARMQIPEYLGGKRIPINVDQVLQTSSTNEVSPQGNTAAYSLTTDISSLFTKSFTEHGMIIGLACVRTDHTYQQGIRRGMSRKTRFDYYWPTLAHISEQAILVKEIYAKGTLSDDDAFGYQEAWADYRYKQNMVTGAFRSNYNGTLDSWHYADYYTGDNSRFVLNPEWLIETPVNIDRTLAVQSDLEDQFLGDFYFEEVCVRPMPLYSQPGLVDHF